MHKIYYYILRTWVKTGLLLFFKKISINGFENIPKDRPVLFAANHQNAFLDALLVVCFNHRYTHFLARADVFNFWPLRAFLHSLNMMPVYRIRDGRESLAKNEEIFNRCSHILQHNGALLMFPEGNHGELKKLRPVSKGFTRIAMNVISSKPDSELVIQPIGINYQSRSSARSDVSLYFGKPILARKYWKSTTSPSSSLELKKSVEAQLRTLIVHIDDKDDYDKIYGTLKNEEVDFTDPVAANKRIEQLKNTHEWSEKISSNHSPKPVRELTIKLLNTIGLINNLLVAFLWKTLLRQIKDPQFIASLKFLYSLVAIPIIYSLQIFIFSLIFSPSNTVLYGVFCLVSPFIWKLK